MKARIAFHVLPVVAAALLAAQAHASSSEAKRKLQEVDTALRDIAIEEKYKKPLPPMAREIEFAERAYEDVNVGVERARVALGQVPAADKADPAVVAATKRVEDFVVYRDGFKRSLDTARNIVKTSHAQTRAFLAENEASKRAVLLFSDVFYGRSAIAPGVDRLKAAMVELAQLDAACKAKWKDVGNPPEGDLDVQPKTWCEIAAKRAEWASKLIAADLAFERKKKDDLLDGVKRSIESNEGFFSTGLFGGRQCVDGVAACRGIFVDQYTPLFDAVGAKLDPSLLASTLSKVVEVAETIDRKAPTLAYPAGTTPDAALLSLATKRVKEGYPTAQVTRAGWTATHTIQTGPVGLPVSRSRRGVVELKVPGEKWCRLAKLATTEQYAGGGRYAPPTLQFADVRFERCK